MVALGTIYFVGQRIHGDFFCVQQLERNFPSSCVDHVIVHCGTHGDGVMMGHHGELTPTQINARRANFKQNTTHSTTQLSKRMQK